MLHRICSCLRIWGRRLPAVGACLQALLSPLLFAREGPETAETENPPILRQATDVLALSFHVAGRRLPVVLEGVVTAAEEDWRGQFFMQDSSGGIFVENLDAHYPRAGDVIRLEGETHPGAFAPIVSKPTWVKLGEAALPDGIEVRIEDLMLGIHDGKRVEVTGVVRAAWSDGVRIWAYLSLGGYRLEVSLPRDLTAEPASLIGSTLNVTGTTATHYNSILRSLTAVAVYVPRIEDVQCLSRELENPFEKPVIPLELVAQYRPDSSSGSQRIHLEGVLTYQAPGEYLFIEDQTAGLKVETRDTRSFRVGEKVSVVGFLEFEQHLPVLKEGGIQPTGELFPLIPIVIDSFDQVKAGQHHAELLRLRGIVVDRLKRPLRDSLDEGVSGVLSLVVSGNGFRFTVECEEDPLAPSSVQNIEPGSVIEVTGVGVSELDVDGALQSLQVKVHHPSQILVIRKPSWWTPRRLWAGASMLAALLAIAVAWTITVSAKNRMLKYLLSERETSQRLLQDAHDNLEQKVEERTQQLQIAMTAKAQAEVEHKAVLSERTRLARDLHDTLEQTLTGIALRLEIASRSFSLNPESSIQHVAMARKWLSQSQEQLRHSIWDLRSRELQQFNLKQALRQIAEAATTDTGIELRFVTEEANHCDLSEVQEENLLRIGQEAITNVIKHARAGLLEVAIRCEQDHLLLSIVDDGIGFEPPTDSMNLTHHFGLLGMHERIQRIGGQLSILSRPGAGTRIEIHIKTENSLQV